MKSAKIFVLATGLSPQALGLFLCKAVTQSLAPDVSVPVVSWLISLRLLVEPELINTSLLNPAMLTEITGLSEIDKTQFCFCIVKVNVLSSPECSELRPSKG